MDLIKTLCRVALENEAEDLYLKADNSPRLRIKGDLIEIEDTIFSEEDMERFLDRCGYDESPTKEADLAWENSAGQRFRVNVFDSLGTRCAVLRPLREVTQSMMALGLPVERLQNWLTRNHGLILFTGATGSGKSTSLASCLSWVSKKFKKHIITIEDPVEYLLKSDQSLVSQRQIGTDTESFDKGLRAALRQSPDVIFVGEIRDYETAKAALHACETGHLVVSTLHSSDVVETVQRLLMLFPAAEREGALHVISRQLLGILSQKLVPGEDGNLHLLVEHLENVGVVKKWLEESEINKIADFLAQGSQGENVTFINSIILAYKSGQISEDIARAACNDPADFNRIILGVSHGSR
ncbi:MAG: pilus retraction protein PilT [Rubritalea sp.]|jgi:pilus retraction protein PilT